MLTSKAGPGCDHNATVVLCRVVDTELHAVLVKQLRDLNYEARHQQAVAIRERMKGVIEIENVSDITASIGTVCFDSHLLPWMHVFACFPLLPVICQLFRRAHRFFEVAQTRSGGLRWT